MDKIEYLDSLKRAMTGLAPEAQARTLAFYEQRFVDGVAAGRNEADIAAEQDDPKKIAMTLRASSHMAAFEQKRNPANFVRMAFAAVGLAIFNLFMVVPAAVYAAMLTTLYICGLVFYLAGAVITASGLSGSDEIKLDGPLREMISEAITLDDDDDLPTRVTINEEGIRIISEKHHARQSQAASTDEDNSAVDDAAEPSTSTHGSTESDPIEAIADKAARRAEAVVSDKVTIATGMDDASRATQVFIGIGLVLGGILLLLLSLVITRYTFIGIKRYIEMNFSLLKGN
jgi:uncharacterized membrane protein